MTYQPVGGVISTNNSSTATLAGDAVFTGVGEDVSDYSSISVNYKSDVKSAASGLSMQFSQDNSNWDIQLVGDLGENFFEVHRLTPAVQYFRIVYTNGSDAQSVFRLQVTYHSSGSLPLVSRSGQPQATTDSSPVRQTTDVDLDYARKHIPGGRAFFFFGANDGVDNSWQDIHPKGGNVTWLTTASVIEIVSTHANDNGTTPSTGCLSVEVHGLSATGADQDEVILTNGLAAVTSGLTYIRVNKMHNETVGTYGGSHQGKISCSVVGSGSVLSLMIGEEGSQDSSVMYGLGEADNGYWTVPLGKVMYITDLECTASATGNKLAHVVLYEREGILNFSSPYDTRRVLWQSDGFQGEVTKTFKSHIKIKALTDVFFRAISTDSAGGIPIDVSLDFYLVDADASGA